MNSWTKFDNLDARGLSIKIGMKRGVEDCWKKNKRLGIRQICVYGNYLDDGGQNKIKNFVLSQFNDVTTLPETILMVQFLAKLFN